MADPVAVMARAAYERVSPLYGGPWGSKPPQERDSLILDMQAALSALDAAGFAVVETSLVEQAFKDGLAYGGNVAGADPDLAWQQSRIRAPQVKP